MGNFLIDVKPFLLQGKKKGKNNETINSWQVAITGLIITFNNDFKNETIDIDSGVILCKSHTGETKQS